MRRPIRNYPRWHQLWDAVQRAAAPVPWPARFGLWFRDSSDVVIDRHEVAAGVPSGAPALRIAFASDFHVGPTTPAQTVGAAVVSGLDDHQSGEPDAAAAFADTAAVRIVLMHAPSCRTAR